MSARPTPLNVPPPYRPEQGGRAMVLPRRQRGVPLPSEEAHQISLRAASYVRTAAPLGPNNSRVLVRATWRQGEVGVHFPPRAIHLLYLDRGIRPFIMWSLEGKTVPIRDPDGSIHFRRARGVGQRVAIRDEHGRFMGSKIRWRHPGVVAMDFVGPSIRRAIKEYAEGRTADQVLGILQAYPGLGRFLPRVRRKA